MEIVLPPGIVKTRSPKASIGRWADGDHVRFVAGLPEKIGGWERMSGIDLLGVPRAIHAYLAFSNTERIGVGSSRKLYSFRPNGTALDITPIRRTANLTNPFETTGGSDIVTVTDTAHGAKIGAIVYVSGGSAVGGITLSGEYEVIKTPTEHTYLIVHSDPATSDATGGGSVTIEYELNPGSQDGAVGVGYGVGLYGMEAYGTPRTESGIVFDPSFWSITNYGQLLLASRNDGGTIYTHNSDSGGRAAAVTNAPTDVLYSFVTGERFIFALCKDLYVKWPDRDDLTDWTPTDLNTANVRRLAGGSKLVAGAALGNRLNLVWSDENLFLFSYSGSAFIYDTWIAGEKCGLVGPAAFTTTSSLAFWMGREHFFMFNGSVVPIPNQEEIRAWVFDHIHPAHRSKTVCFYNEKFREVWWIYPTRDVTEPNRYVMVNVDNWAWSIGTLSRSAAGKRLRGGYQPLLASPDGVIYTHETGKNDDGASLPAYIKSGLYQLDPSTSLDVFGVSPDFTVIEGEAEMRITGRDRPQSQVTDEATFTVTGETEMEDIRLHGRLIEVEVIQDEVNGDFRLGVPWLEVQDGNRRR